MCGGTDLVLRPTESTSPADWIGIDCLTSADCQAGLRCCAFAELTHCAAECEESEACVPGLTESCHAGSRCEASDSRSLPSPPSISLSAFNNARAFSMPPSESTKSRAFTLNGSSR